MSLPFINMINNNTPGLTAQEKLQMLDDWCYNNGYEDEIPNADQTAMIPNPESKSDFFDRIQTHRLKSEIKNYRQRTAVVEELNI